MKKDIWIYWDLFLNFLKVGLFTFGGGYAMISVITDLCVDKKQWMTHDEMMDMTVVAESTPGPIAINCATYVGYKVGGMAGAVAATVGVVLPSFVIIYLISMYLDHFLEYPLVAKAFRGIRIGVGILILNVGYTMLKKMPSKRMNRIIAGCSFCAMLMINIFSLKISSITLMLAAAAVSLGIFAVSPADREKGGEGR